MMKKKKAFYTAYIPVFLLGIFYVYKMDQLAENNRKLAPEICFEKGLEELIVKTISFERNNLYFNDTLYNSEGISSYTRVKSKNTVEELSDIKSPFKIKKKSNNDTLEFYKNGKLYYILLTEEINFSQDN
ncbi:hypothetical protein GR160_09520 [Flavobacterium sp. Sd200]|uniref:hypothetical protein n=1 Tax=Flavobacterium sp. Sd200 TaxID=2692211 RepID=UPI001371EC84|nr:hypothetical protein [Flavobacterium sp. Sd200]MXN91467.1 hypothetical protein [Flavobacterium sp. Sd200]